MTEKKVKIIPNSKDVAKLAGVSQSCVSKYLTNIPYVSEITRKKIEDAIRKLDYKPDSIARSLVSKKTYNIGLIVLDITNPFYSGVVRGIEKAIKQEKSNYSLILGDISDKNESSDNYINLFIGKRVDGILTTSEKISRESLALLNKLGIPIIFINRHVSYPDITIDYVTVDNFKGAYMMVDYLIKIGHKDIGYISGPLGTVSMLNRLLGYSKALENSEIKIKDELIKYSYNIDSSDGYKCAEKFLSSTDLPTAIFCANDYTAYGVIDYCLKNGVNIPDDISIAGFDDIPFSSLDFVNLTTARVPIEELGSIAVKELIEKIRGNSTRTIRIILTPEIIIRKSTSKSL